MFKLIIHTNTDRMPEVLVDTNRTIAEVLAERNIGTAGVTLNLNGALLPMGSMNSTFAEIGVQPGTKAILSTIVKADSAA